MYPDFVPVDVGVDESDLIGEGVEVMDAGGIAPFLAGELAVEFVDAVEQPPKEDAEVGHFARFAFFFQAQWR